MIQLLEKRVTLSGSKQRVAIAGCCFKTPIMVFDDSRLQSMPTDQNRSSLIKSKGSSTIIISSHNNLMEADTILVGQGEVSDRNP